MLISIVDILVKLSTYQLLTHYSPLMLKHLRLVDKAEYIPPSAYAGIAE
jgi:hypothetical protein